MLVPTFLDLLLLALFFLLSTLCSLPSAFCLSLYRVSSICSFREDQESNPSRYSTFSPIFNSPKKQLLQQRLRRLCAGELIGNKGCGDRDDKAMHVRCGDRRATPISSVLVCCRWPRPFCSGGTPGPRRPTPSSSGPRALATSILR